MRKAGVFARPRCFFAFGDRLFAGPVYAVLVDEDHGRVSGNGDGAFRNLGAALNGRAVDDQIPAVAGGGIGHFLARGIGNDERLLTVVVIQRDLHPSVTKGGVCHHGGVVGSEDLVFLSYANEMLIVKHHLVLVVALLAVPPGQNVAIYNYAGKRPIKGDLVIALFLVDGVFPFGNLPLIGGGRVLPRVELGLRGACRRSAWSQASLQRERKNARKRIFHDHLVAIGVRLSELANTVYLSPSHLGRKFHRNVGMSIGDYVKRLRMDMVARLLISTNCSITEICYELGFVSLSTFSLEFKRIYGVVSLWQIE